MIIMVNYAENVGKGSMRILVFSLAAALLGYFFRVFLSKALDTSEFGLFYSVMAFLAVFSIFSEFGWAEALPKFIAELKAKNEYAKIKSITIIIFLSRFAMSAIVLLPLLLLSPYLEANYFRFSPASFVLQLAIAESIINMGYFTIVFQGLQKFNVYAIIELTRISILFVLAYALIGMGVVGVAIANLLTTLAMGAIFIFLLLKKFPFFLKERFEFDKELTKKVMKFGLILWTGSVLTVILSRSDILILTYFRTLEEVGFYNIALPTAALLSTFISPLTTTLYPTISALWAKKETAAISKGLSAIVKLAFVFLLPVSLVFAGFSSVIIENIFGPKFLAASGALIVLSLSTLFYSVAVLFLTAAKAMGYPWISTRIVLTAAITNMAFNFALIPVYGIEGAAAAALASSLVAAILAYACLNEKIKLGIPVKKIAGAISGGFFMLLIILVVKEMIKSGNVVLESFIVLSAAAAFYLFYIVFFRVITKDDFRLFLMTKIYIPENVKKAVFRILKT